MEIKTKKDVYENELKQLLQTYSTDYNAQLLYKLAKLYSEKSDFILAKSTAQKAIELYPKSNWINNSKILIEEIERKDANLEIPQDNAANEWIPIVIDHKNTNKIYIKSIYIIRKIENIIVVFAFIFFYYLATEAWPA